MQSYGRKNAIKKVKIAYPNELIIAYLPIYLLQVSEYIRSQ